MNVHGLRTCYAKLIFCIRRLRETAVFTMFSGPLFLAYAHVTRLLFYSFEPRQFEFGNPQRSQRPVNASNTTPMVQASHADQHLAYAHVTRGIQSTCRSVGAGFPGLGEAS